MTDSVPAPMVQIPAETVEALREIVEQGYVSFNPHELFRRARRLVDAATPAATPAADILALADKWDRENPEGSEWIAALIWGSNELRALVAAAEQADKGEGGQRGGKSQDTATPHEPSLTAPAAPPEPLCRCGHAKSEHAQGSFSCGRVIEGSGCELHVCSCSVFRYGSPARVPVNDEAEAQLWLIRNSKTGKWFMGSVGGDDGIWAKNIAMSVVYTSSESGPVYGLPEDGEWVRFRAARGEDA